MRGWLIICGIAAMCCVAWPRAAHAQWLATGDRPELILMSTGTTTAVVAGAIVLTVVSIKKEPKTLALYLQANEPAVRAALALGAGDALDDLASLLGLPADLRHRLGPALRSRRRELTTAAFETRDAARFREIALAAAR